MASGTWGPKVTKETVPALRTAPALGDGGALRVGCRLLRWKAESLLRWI